MRKGVFINGFFLLTLGGGAVRVRPMIVAWCAANGVAAVANGDGVAELANGFGRKWRRAWRFGSADDRANGFGAERGGGACVPCSGDGCQWRGGVYPKISGAIIGRFVTLFELFIRFFDIKKRYKRKNGGAVTGSADPSMRSACRLGMGSADDRANGWRFGSADPSLLRIGRSSRPFSNNRS